MSERRTSVLFVTSNFPRWADDNKPSFVLDLARAMAQRGIEVTVLAPHARTAERAEQWGEISVQRFRYMWPTRAQRLVDEGAIMVNLRHRPWLWLLVPMYLMGLWLGVRRLLRTEHFDLAHSHWVVPQGAVVAWALRKHRIAHVITVHGGDVFTLRSRVVEVCKRWAFLRADKVIVNSSATGLEVLRIASGAVEPATIPQGVVERESDPEAVDRIRVDLGDGDGPRLLFVGRLVKEKGVADLITAFSLIIEQLPRARLVILGDGQDRKSFETLAETAGIADRISFLGWVHPSQVANHLAAADIFVAPSKRSPDGWVEAQNLAIGEALGASLPVVATDAGGIPDYVTDHVNGLIVAENSPQELASAVVRLVEEPELANRLRAAARQTFTDRLAMTATSAQILDVYQDITIGSRADD